MAQRNESAVLIAGPTASGKSALALGLYDALSQRGVKAAIVNCDAMQIYREIPILAASPSARDHAHAPHHLYGVLSVADAGSAGRYIELIDPVLHTLWAKDVLPLIVGGTGLYFRALTDGLAPTPPVPPAIVEEGQAVIDTEGAAALHTRLAAIDPVMAARLEPLDQLRVLRAWSVMRATGRSLADWQAETTPGLLSEATLVKAALVPERDWLYTRCDQRFDLMLQYGAWDEVRALHAAGFDPRLPAMRALGVPQLIQALSGEIEEAKAIETAKRETRRYAKRQLTWIRNQMISWERLGAQQMERSCDILLSKIDEKGLIP